MYIEPSSNIRILKDVPLDNTYEHTIYFNNRSLQTQYFAGKTKHHITNSSYQRVQRGRARVGILAENLYDCNYMMFQNTAFGNKWFYAFITGVEYINNVTSEISFEIDDMQTWNFDYELEQCLVEREHSLTDQLRDHTLPEPIDIGEYVTDASSRSVLQDLADMDIVVATGQYFNLITITDTIFVLHGKYTGVYNPSYYYVFCHNHPNLEATIDNFLNQIVSDNKIDSIISVFMCPHYITHFFKTQQDGGLLPTAHMSNILPFASSKVFGTWEKPDGSTWTPKNNKLYTYPYNFLYLYDNVGENASILEPQFYFPSEGNYRLDAMMALTCNPSITIYPHDYKGRTDGVEYGITLNSYPQCSYNIDTVRAWIANGGDTRALLNIVGGTFGAGSAIMSGHPLVATGSALGVAQNINSLVVNMTKGDSSRGQNTATPSVADMKYFPIMERRMVNYVSAKAIDDFFTQYGYTCNLVKIPNRNARPHWTYTQTRKCNLKGSVPADTAKHICSIYDRGITFWRFGDEIGNYSLDNSPD